MANKEKICIYCGAKFIKGRNTPGFFCSKKCSSKYHRHTRSPKDEEALKEVKQLRKEARQCAEQLKRLTSRIKSIERKIAQRKCTICGALFYPTRYASRYCSNACARKADNMRRDKRLYRNGKPDFSITLEKVYERDRGICQLCNSFLIFGNDTNADSYPSIDHIKPLSKGGRHEWDNVQLACRGCNRQKGNRD